MASAGESMANSTPEGQRDKSGRFVPGHSIGVKFKPGQSGNPGGGLKKPASITKHLREELGKLMPNGKTKAQMIAEGMVEAALFPVSVSGSPKVLSEVLDRTEGKVTQPIGGDKDKPLIIRVIYDDKETDV
ncbi:hypothetical protein LCGC14_1206110 [marine sediment metagenome]|uniref:DUF5681 domain-containing protein n=1 Tax=marine sediment metagenome TaxID=412755 RepID=A0A0F9LJU8_9ZZZZ